MNTPLVSKNVTPINEEVKWDKTKTIISKTDLHGTILYMNDAFEQASEYNKIELIGEPHNIIRHPDMPKVVFKELWKSLKKEENYHAIVKNLTRTGRYYWVITDFEIERDEKGKATGYTGRRRAISQEIINKIKPLYKTLLDIEKVKGEKASEMYFKAYLDEEVQKSYADFVVDLFQSSKKVEEQQVKKRGLRTFFFG